MELTARSLKARARQVLSQAEYSPRKLVLLHSGAALALGLVLSLLTFVLDRGIGETGGLGGIGTRSVLVTVQTVLQMGNTLLLPFWNIGFIMATLHQARCQGAHPRCLLDGFRHFGPVLRMNLLQGCIYLAVMVIAGQIGSTVFLMTPAAQGLYELTEEMLAAGTTDLTQILDEAAMTALVLDMLPFMAGAMVLLMVPVFYRLRMMDYVLMDRPELGAFFSLKMSLFMTRKNCMKLVKLDLSYWWFFALELLAAVVCYGDWILAAVGVDLGMSAATASFAFYVAGLLCQLGLYAWKKDELSAVYALAYDALLPPPPAQEGSEEA